MNERFDLPIVLLLVEDNPADVVFFQEACRTSQTTADIHVARSGIEALQFLRREAPFERAPRPDVVVLDLNLPLLSGKEVISKMTSDPAINSIPLAILTTSIAEAHLCDLYLNGRCVYFTKTDDLKRLQEIIGRILTHSRVR